MSVNEVARVLIFIAVRVKTALTGDRIHWCKTAYHQIDKSLATHGRTIHPGQSRPNCAIRMATNLQTSP